MNPRPVVIHNSIERDNRLKWHPLLELRHKGVVIYAITSVQGHMQPAKAAAHGIHEMNEVISVYNLRQA